MQLQVETQVYKRNAIGAINTKVDGAAARQQRIYFRTNAARSFIDPDDYPVSWLNEENFSTNTYNTWVTKIPPIAASTGANAPKYLYLYTCIQREAVDGTLSHTAALLDDTTTIIDGGNIITGSITANQIAAHAITADQIDTSTITISSLADASDYVTTDTIIASITAQDEYYLSTSPTEVTGSIEGWQPEAPTWVNGTYIWTRIATTKTTVDNVSTTEYSTPVYDEALTTALSTAASAQNTANSAAASVITRKEYYLSTSSSQKVGGSWGENIPTWSGDKYIWIRFKTITTPISGTESISYAPTEVGIYDSALTTALSTTKYITKIDDAGIKIHPYSDSTHNIDASHFLSLTAEGMQIYNGGATSNNIIAKFNTSNNNPEVIIGYTDTGQYNTYIDSQGLYLRSGTNEHAILDEGGLTLLKGGIRAGRPYNSDFVLISSDSYGNYTINNHQASDWKALIGTKFGVRADGTLYATDAVINGDITIAGHTDSLATEISSLQTDVANNLVYDHTYEINNTGDVINSVTFTAHVYRNGEEVTDEFDDEQFIWYYKNESLLTRLPLNNNINKNPKNSGKTITISSTTPVTIAKVLTYGTEIIGSFRTYELKDLLHSDGRTFTNYNDQILRGVTYDW